MGTKVTLQQGEGNPFYEDTEFDILVKEKQRLKQKWFQKHDKDRDHDDFEDYGHRDRRWKRRFSDDEQY